MSSRKCKGCGEFFSIKLAACPACGQAYHQTGQAHEYHKPTAAEREAWPNPATRPMPPPTMNPLCEEIRAAYAKSEHGRESTHPLIARKRGEQR